MGIYDRDYYRQSDRHQQPGLSLHMPQTIVGTLILVNVVIWVADAFTPTTEGGGRLLSDLLAVHVDTLTQPWLWWQFVTYGFAHSPQGFGHILFNMLVLWFLGRDIEFRYGRWEFLRLYLATLVFASLVWAVLNHLQQASAAAFGASGAIAGVVVLYALNFPRRTLLLFFVLPVPAWLVGVLAVSYDMLGTINRSADDNVAYTIHLAGAAFAFLYYRQGWNLGRLFQGRFALPRFKSRPKLRVHRPDHKDSGLSKEVDRILEKIHREGEASLTRRERRILEDASQQYQKRRQAGDD